MSEPQIEVLYEFEKPRATVRAYVTDFRGKRFAYIREFVEPRDRPGAPLIATKAGICVEVGDLDELEAAVRALRAAAAYSWSSTSVCSRVCNVATCRRSVLNQNTTGLASSRPNLTRCLRGGKIQTSPGTEASPQRHDLGRVNLRPVDDADHDVVRRLRAEHHLGRHGRDPAPGHRSRAHWSSPVTSGDPPLGSPRLGSGAHYRLAWPVCGWVAASHGRAAAPIAYGHSMEGIAAAWLVTLLVARR
jgi:hypothetical protein